ncbi:MAG: ATP-binding protein [Longimicrobiales bacterium]
MTDHYRHLYASAPLPILSVDREGHVVACNPALAGLIGRSATELHGTPVLKWLGTTERDAARAGFLRAFESGKAEWDSVIRRWDGTMRPVRVQSVRQQTAKGVHLDVFLNERGVERSVRAADAAVLDLLTNMPGLFALVLDNELRIRHACGMSRTHWCRDLDVIGRELVSLLNPSDENAVQLESLRREIARGESWAGTLRHIRADDSAFPVHVYATPRVDPRTREPVGLVLAGRETGDEVALRDQLEVAERLASIGRVTTSVARELSAGVIAARAIIDMDEPRINDARTALVNLQRISQTLLAFSSDVVVERAPVALAPVVQDVLRELGEIREEVGADVVVSLPDDLPELAVDVRHLREILRQVMTNAFDAMRSSEERVLRIEAAGDAGAVTIEVSDTGQGIMDGETARVFEPFFTTRTHRLGLGLAIARGMVVAHGGGITLSSSETGTTASIELPCEARASSLPFRAAPLVLGTARSVLLVDDDAAVRGTFRKVLQKVGYRTSEAWSGRSALAVLANGAPPDFLITDLRMTGGNGYWLLRQIGRDYPDLLKRTVIVTGDDSDTYVDRVASETGCAVLRKPVGFTLLLEVLDSLALRTAEAGRAVAAERRPAEAGVAHV